MKLLVTGGAGFIGSNFIRYWLNKHTSDRIINLDSLTYAGHISSTHDYNDNTRYRFVHGSICNRGDVEKAIKGCDIVVHFAAESHVDRSIANPGVFVNTNVTGTYILLEESLKVGVSRFHHVSTDEVFGSLQMDTQEKFTESTAYQPRSPYAASKASSDHFVRAFYTTYGLPVTITNCSNNYGSFQDPEKFIPRCITNLIDNRHVPLYGDGKNVRDWLHVYDHCRAIETVIKDGTVGETYLVGGLTEDYSNFDVVQMILQEFGRTEEFIDFIADRPGHDRRYAVDWTKINKQLSWKPMYNFSEWLHKTVEWYKDNQWWWRPLKQEAEEFYSAFK